MFWNKFDMGNQPKEEKRTLTTYTGKFFVNENDVVVIELEHSTRGEMCTSTRGVEYYSGDVVERSFIGVDGNAITVDQGKLKEFNPLILIHSCAGIIEPANIIMHIHNYVDPYNSDYNSNIFMQAGWNDLQVTLRYRYLSHTLKMRYENAFKRRFKKRLAKCETFSDLLRR